MHQEHLLYKSEVIPQCRYHVQQEARKVCYCLCSCMTEIGLSLSEKRIIFIPTDVNLDIIVKKTCSGQHISDIQRWIGGK